MKVLLRQDIERLGRMGEVVEVARGYARNYLIPKGLAIGVTRGGLKDIQQQQRVLEIKAARERERLAGVAEKIKSGRIVIKARCSASGKLFGSITNRQLAGEIEAVAGEEIDRHKVIIDGRIRTVGPHRAKLRLHPDIVLDLEFEVEGEGFVPEEPPEEEEEAKLADKESELSRQQRAEQQEAEETYREEEPAEAVAGPPDGQRAEQQETQEVSEPTGEEEGGMPAKPREAGEVESQSSAGRE